MTAVDVTVSRVALALCVLRIVSVVTRGSCGGVTVDKTVMVGAGAVTVTGGFVVGDGESVVVEAESVRVDTEVSVVVERLVVVSVMVVAVAEGSCRSIRLGV